MLGDFDVLNNFKITKNVDIFPVLDSSMEDEE